jgi:hypothetical protein
MIVGLVLFVLFAISVHVRRVINRLAMLVVCIIVWSFMWAAVPLESQRRKWRVVGIAALVALLLVYWKTAELLARAIRHLP